MAEPIRTNVLVIGSGPGGAVTGLLCAEAGRSVLMIEDGPDLPVDSAPPFSLQEIAQKYRGGGIGVAFGPAKLAYVEGRCVGGGSEVNRGLYHRAPASLLDRWHRDFQVRDLSPEVMAAHFEACEAIARVEYLPGRAPGISTRLRDGAEALGWAAVEARRLYCYGGEAAGKQSMSRTFVPRFRAAGGELRAGLRAVRLARSGSGWLVEAVQRADVQAPRSISIQADTVFVACGAVQTPALLRRSGITRNIGSSLRFHPMLKMVAEFPDEVNKPGDLDPVHQVKEFEPEVGMGCSVSTPSTLALALNADAEAQGRIASRWRRMGMYYVQSTGGRARVRNLPFFRDPLVTFQFDRADRARLVQGLRDLGRALFAAGAVRVYPAVAGCPAVSSPRQLDELSDAIVRQEGSLSSVHVFSSCPMGEDEERCATDSYGRVRGAEGLHIADASLLCTPTSVNPQGTVMAVARRNVLHVLDAGEGRSHRTHPDRVPELVA